MKTLPLSHLLVASALYVCQTCAVTLTDISQLKELTYDYIIIGAGNAGLVIADRLTENANTSVLVLEAGVSDQGVIPVMAPFLGPSVTPNTPYDWNYTIIPQPGLDGRTFPYPRGRLLGGCTSANYMIHQYGSTDDWAEMAKITGDPGWQWNNVKQYIKRHEKFVAPSDGHNTTGQFIPSLHSFTGELPISLPINNQTIDPRVINTTQQLPEFPFNEDMSGVDGSYLGVGWVQSSMDAGLRGSSSSSYLATSNDRPNLTVMINAMVTKLIQTNSTPAQGLKAFRTVQFADARNATSTTRFQVQANKDIILSAGSIGTPQILQLSGIGDPADLTPLKIPVLVDSPLVGKNMMDHPLLPNIWNVNGNDSFDHILRNANLLQAAISQWATNKTGFIANNVINNFGFGRLNASLLSGLTDPSSGPDSPHFEMIFANFWLNPNVALPPTGSYLTTLTALLTPTSRGTVKIQSTDAFIAPLINPNMLDTEVDIVIMRESVRAIKRFISAPAWKDYVISPFGNLSATADADIDSYVRQHTTTVFHPSSTASMTSETSTNGVVNPDFTVKGVDGLRIVDLSVFPFIPSCHPQGPLYLVAERAADIIKGIVSTR
ncbi:GMC oxidoreductase [Hypholoma sublateritium FD-334 SS-4]|uniref:pyranose dehydrogenase (acceptor) n=1 Tax=Hypholoma sublateritium (strain FD-334 SS-4) TaxID=945553 RepID=A0A0D2MLS7_HYPSF|nr:GMC oxidoreductase [Hypholoma sublateritium FD-334 SS-4]